MHERVDEIRTRLMALLENLNETLSGLTGPRPMNQQPSTGPVPGTGGAIPLLEERIQAAMALLAECREVAEKIGEQVALL